MRSWTSDQLDKEIFKYEPQLVPLSDEHWAYRILMCVPVVGPFPSNDPDDCIKAVRKFWGSRDQRIRIMCHRGMRQCLWRYGSTHSKQFLDSEIYSEGLGFAMGATVLLGWLKRVKAA